MTSTNKVRMFFVPFLLVIWTLSRLPARGDASKSGCTHSEDRAEGCSKDPVSVPEPETDRLIGVGMILVGGAVTVSNARRLIRSYLSSLRQ